MISSTWIAEIRSRKGYLAIFLLNGSAILYSNVPPYLAGLVAAGTGKRSPGHAYHLMVKGKYLSQTIKKEDVPNLRKLIEGKES